MYTLGICVCFVCKGCAESFEYIADFIQHKKKFHSEQLRKIKYIVFEEQDEINQNDNYSRQKSGCQCDKGTNGQFHQLPSPLPVPAVNGKGNVTDTSSKPVLTNSPQANAKPTEDDDESVDSESDAEFIIEIEDSLLDPDMVSNLCGTRETPNPNNTNAVKNRGESNIEFDAVPPIPRNSNTNNSNAVLKKVFNDAEIAQTDDIPMDTTDNAFAIPNLNAQFLSNVNSNAQEKIKGSAEIQSIRSPTGLYGETDKEFTKENTNAILSPHHNFFIVELEFEGSSEIEEETSLENDAASGDVIVSKKHAASEYEILCENQTASENDIFSKNQAPSENYNLLENQAGTEHENLLENQDVSENDIFLKNHATSENEILLENSAPLSENETLKNQAALEHEIFLESLAALENEIFSTYQATSENDIFPENQAASEMEICLQNEGFSHNETYVENQTASENFIFSKHQAATGNEASSQNYAVSEKDAFSKNQAAPENDIFWKNQAALENDIFAKNQAASENGIFSQNQTPSEKEPPLEMETTSENNASLDEITVIRIQPPLPSPDERSKDPDWSPKKSIKSKNSPLSRRHSKTRKEKVSLKKIQKQKKSKKSHSNSKKKLVNKNIGKVENKNIGKVEQVKPSKIFGKYEWSASLKKFISKPWIILPRKECHLDRNGDSNSNGIGDGDSANSNNNPTETMKLIKCSQCPKEYMTKTALKLHAESHKTEAERPGPFKCSECDYSTDRQAVLVDHMRRHTGDRPFKCPYPACAKTFRTSCNVHRHMKSHRDPKKIKCPVPACHQLFKFKTNLEFHMATHASESEMDATTAGVEFQKCSKLIITNANKKDLSKKHIGRKDKSDASSSSSRKLKKKKRGTERKSKGDKQRSKKKHCKE